MKKSTHQISRQVAIIFAVLCLLMSIVFFNIYKTDTSVEKDKTVSVVSEFDSYELQYGRHHTLNYALITLENGEQLSILGICVNTKLQSEIKEMEKGTKIQALISTETNTVVEIMANGEEILNFDYAQKKLKQEGVGFLYLGIFLVVLCLYFIYQAITTKERITKEDIKFYWDIIRKK